MRRLKGGKRGYRLRDTKLPAKVSQFCDFSLLTSSPFLLQLYAGTRKNTNHALVKLPAEVKNMIFKALPTAADRACLALTCKDQASVYDELSKETNKKDYDQKVPLRTSIVHRLLLLARLKADMPAGYNLCYHCVQFIKIDDSENRGTWGGSFERVKSLVSYPLTAQGCDGGRTPLPIVYCRQTDGSRKS